MKKTSTLSSRPVVVITHRVHDQVKQLLSAECRVICNDSQESWTPDVLLQQASQADALMVFMPDSVDDHFLSQCPNLKVVAAALKGFDNFDVEACTRRGVWFTIVPDLLTQPTAELALGLALGITRNVLPGDRLVRSDNYRGWRPVLYGRGLRGQTIGIIGMGKVGQAFAGLLAGFDTTIFYSDRTRLSPQEESRLRVSRVDFDHLISISDVVVLLVPLQNGTLHLINKATLGQMKRGSYLVNVGRGSVVDEEAVAEALASSQLAGYAADVFEMEDWARPDHPQTISARLLANSANTLFTPHLGSAVDSVRLEIELAAARNILKALNGQEPADAINQPRPAEPVVAADERRLALKSQSYQ
ncbi:MAG TPA: phosphonate dehydrogenase [Candidatus Angelobacter sp.]|jgi:phosphonate dehydrogenase|nr:phosphonate dehydrogenase [Candidatus Angelobacter sp.]